MDKDKLSKTIDVSFLRQLENSDYLTSSLRTLANVLYKEYNKHPILLIDEYDVPLARASFHDSQNSKLYKDDKNFVADYHKRRFFRKFVESTEKNITIFISAF